MFHRTYKIFISHSWKYSDGYERIIRFLNEQNLRYSDHSVPINDPIHTNGTDEELALAIEAKIKHADCVLILAGVYATYSRWINIETEIAKHHAKPIIAIEHWGAERSSTIAKNSADTVVKWQGKSIV